jgi:NAD(P)-dependent dehydrogenase (short-subunit alcohol dehydrogenase family)
MGADAVAIKADMSKPEDVDKLFKETAAAFSDPVSILVRFGGLFVASSSLLCFFGGGEGSHCRCHCR